MTKNKLLWRNGLILIGILYVISFLSLFIGNIIDYYNIEILIMIICLSLIIIVIVKKWDIWHSYLKYILVVFSLHIFYIILSVIPCLRLASECSMLQLSYTMPIIILFLYLESSYSILLSFYFTNEWINFFIIWIINIIFICTLSVLIKFIFKKSI